VEDVAADALAHGHAQVDIEANSGDAHAGILLVLGHEVTIVVVMVVAVEMARVGARLRLGGAHDGRGNSSSAVGCLRPMEGRWPQGDGFFCRRGAENAQLPGYYRVGTKVSRR
jgi:hypothetical protein